ELARRIRHVDGRGRGTRHRIIPGRLTVRELRGVATHDHGRTDEPERRRRLLGLLQRDERRERRVHVDLLLDRGELHELLGELVGVKRRKRVLGLQLRGEQGQEGIEVAGNVAEARGSGGGAGGRGRGGRSRDRGRGHGRDPWAVRWLASRWAAVPPLGLGGVMVNGWLRRLLPNLPRRTMV